jgi:hypothetical protein
VCAHSPFRALLSSVGGGRAVPSNLAFATFHPFRRALVHANDADRSKNPCIRTQAKGPPRTGPPPDRPGTRGGGHVARAAPAGVLPSDRSTRTRRRTGRDGTGRARAPPPPADIPAATLRAPEQQTPAQPRLVRPLRSHRRRRSIDSSPVVSELVTGC